MSSHPLAVRVGPAWSDVPNPHQIPIRLMATEDVPVAGAALRQAVATGSLHERLRAHGGAVRDVVLTPDLHRGAGIPVGAVVDTAGGLAPGLIGSDIGCGMRLLVVELEAGEIDGLTEPLARALRHVFFAGGRDVRLDARQREALLTDGVYGLLGEQPAGGLWDAYPDAERHTDLDRAHANGSLHAATVFEGFARWVHDSAGHDGQLGAVGGGNHFVELGRVAELFDGPTAWEWGLRPGALTVMAHTGSLGFGRAVAAALGSGDPLVPLTGPAAERYLDGMRQAANFASANRLLLGRMALRALAEVLGHPVGAQLVGDAPHNLIWEHDGGVFRHRKGATPALGPGATGPFAHTGEPVLIPGSMGASSFVLAGNGDPHSLQSASHGAGRVLSRGRAARTEDPDLPRLQVVGPLDPAQLIGRRDLLAELHARLREEAPGAYKPVRPVVDSVIAAGAARPVARIDPLITIKG